LATILAHCSPSLFWTSSSMSNEQSFFKKNILSIANHRFYQRCCADPRHHTTAHRMAANRRLDRRRDDLYAGESRKSV
jgi:hypothetical protein